MRPVNKRQHCGSVYLIPDGYCKTRPTTRQELTLRSRFISLLVVVVAPFLTVFVWSDWLIYGARNVGVDFSDAMYYLFKYFPEIIIMLAVVSFVIGPERLANLMGVLWGAVKRF